MKIYRNSVSVNMSLYEFAHALETDAFDEVLYLIDRLDLGDDIMEDDMDYIYVDEDFFSELAADFDGEFDSEFGSAYYDSYENFYSNGFEEALQDAIDMYDPKMSMEDRRVKRILNLFRDLNEPIH